MKRMHTDREIRAMAVDSVEQKSALKVFENIVDKDGHKRFIEGDITTETISGCTYTYKKWSLSGSHLQIVLAMTYEAGTYSTHLLGTITDIPKWIMDKITPSGATEKQVAVKYAEQWVDSNTPQTPSFYGGVQKDDANTLQIASWGSKTFTAETYIRLSFDLIIDNA